MLDLPAWTAPASGLGVMAAVFWMVVRGYLVPPKLVHREEYNRVKAERDEAMQLSRELMEQNRQLLTGARVTVDVLQAIRPKTDDTVV